MTIVKQSDVAGSATHCQEGVVMRLGSGDPNWIVCFRKPGATSKGVLTDSPNPFFLAILLTECLVNDGGE
jgi:hypothetical protein